METTPGSWEKRWGEDCCPFQTFEVLLAWALNSGKPRRHCSPSTLLPGSVSLALGPGPQDCAVEHSLGCTVGLLGFWGQARVIMVSVGVEVIDMLTCLMGKNSFIP